MDAPAAWRISSGEWQAALMTGCRPRRGIGLLRGLNGGGSRVGVEVDSVGTGIEGYLRGTVDEDPRGFARGADGFDDARGERLKLSEGEILFADLDGVDAAARPQVGERNQAIALRAFVAVEQVAVGNGVKQHLGLV
jgi:hypothetical protein